MMIMVHGSKRARQLAFVMAVYIAERRNAATFGMFFYANGIKQIPYQVSHGFRPVKITAFMHYDIKLLGELII